jgi:hypothetical protein
MMETIFRNSSKATKKGRCIEWGTVALSVVFVLLGRVAVLGRDEGLACVADALI